MKKMNVVFWILPSVAKMDVEVGGWAPVMVSATISLATMLWFKKHSGNEAYGYEVLILICVRGWCNKLHL